MPQRHPFAAFALALVLTGCLPDAIELKPKATSATTAGSGGSTGEGGSTPFVVPDEVASWLSSQKGGFCNVAKDSYVNLCGNVPYCQDGTLLKAYPDGLSVDVGFHWAGQNGGSLLVLGGEIPEHQRLAIDLAIDGTLSVNGPNQGETLSYRIAFGPHLVSYRASMQRRALFVDGVRVAASEASSLPVALTRGTCGNCSIPNGDPGAILGHSATNQMGGANEASWLRFAPFLFHLRSGVDSFDTFSLDDAVMLSATRSVRLFYEAVPGATTWKPLAGPFAAVAVGASFVEDVDGSCL
jgi:hypothetical protein